MSLQRDLPTRTKRKLHAIGGARGVWSIPVRQPLKVNGVSSGSHKPFQTDNDTVIVSTDVNPSPGLSRVSLSISKLSRKRSRSWSDTNVQIASRSTKNDLAITTRLAVTTIGAGPFFQRTAIVHVITDAIRILEPGE